MARILIFILLAAFASTSAIAADDGHEETQIRTTLTAMWAALEAGDIERYATFVHPEYTLFGESDLYRFEGKALELRGMRDWLGRAKNVHTEMHDSQVVVRGDVAWITYYWTDAGQLAGERFTSRGKSTRIFVKEEGRWLCIHGHFTAVP